MPERSQFSIAGIPVRVEPVFFVIMALFGYQLVGRGRCASCSCGSPWPSCRSSSTSSATA